MKQTDIIRLGIIAVALFLAYNGIMYLIGLVDFLFNAALRDYNPGGQGILSFLLNTICLLGVSVLLIKNSRRISVFIDEQK